MDRLDLDVFLKKTYSRICFFVHWALVLFVCPIFLSSTIVSREPRVRWTKYACRSEEEHNAVRIVTNALNAVILEDDCLKNVWVIYGSVKARWSLHHVMRRIILLCRNVIVLEQPPISRGVVTYGFSSDSFRIGLNGFLRSNCFRLLSPEIMKYRQLTSAEICEPKPIMSDDFRRAMIVGQLPGDASLEGLDIFDWIDRIVTLTEDTYGEIVIRTPQIGYHNYRNRLHKVLCRENVTLEVGTYDNKAEAISSSSCVFSYSSTFAVDVLRFGVMQCVDGAGSFLYEVFPTSDGYMGGSNRDRFTPSLVDLNNRYQEIRSIEYNSSDFDEESMLPRLLIERLTQI